MKNREAQFMLLAGFIIAIGLVITTVILNSIIFEGNMAIVAGDELSKNEIINLMQITREEGRSAYRNATSSGGSDSQKIINFSYQMRNFSAGLPKIYVLHGEAVNVTWDAGNWQDLRYPYFTENGLAGGAANWTVMESVNNISLFELRNVSGNYFEVNISNQTTGVFLWSMKLNGTDNITVRNTIGYIYNSAVNFSYIDLLDGTYQLKTTTGSNISKILYRSGSGASGRFNITGNTSYGRDFIRDRDYVLNATVKFSTSRVHANITIPFTVPW